MWNILYAKQHQTNAESKTNCHSATGTVESQGSAYGWEAQRREKRRIEAVYAELKAWLKGSLLKGSQTSQGKTKSL